MRQKGGRNSELLNVKQFRNINNLKERNIFITNAMKIIFKIMISIKNVSKSYDKKVNAVDNASLEIEDGEIFGFLGPNGAGKTTTIKLITGVLLPDNGEVTINGIDIVKEPLAAKRQIGFVPDDPNIFLRLKGIEYLNFMADIYKVDKKERKEGIEKLADLMEMQTALNDKIQSYSHGMKQKIVIMAALLHKPPVWILDEPMTGLDPKSSFTLKEMMKEHKEAGKTVFFSTHILDVAEKICDRVAIINKGKILFCGTLEEMRKHRNENESLEDMFLELTENTIDN